MRLQSRAFSQSFLTVTCFYKPEVNPGLLTCRIESMDSGRSLPLYTVKNVIVFPVPIWETLVGDIPAGYGKTITFFKVYLTKSLFSVFMVIFLIFL
jgi:hypothetical protein